MLTLAEPDAPRQKKNKNNCGTVLKGFFISSQNNNIIMLYVSIVHDRTGPDQSFSGSKTKL